MKEPDPTTPGTGLTDEKPDRPVNDNTVTVSRPVHPTPHDRQGRQQARTADPDIIRTALGILTPPGGVVELRIIETDRAGTVSGYFDNLEQATAAAQAWSGKAPAVYATINEVEPALLARAANRMKQRARHTTADPDIRRRRLLLVDADAIRPAGISATDEQHQDALGRAARVRDCLTRQGWPLPVYADSGNGGHLLYAIDLPNDDPAKELIRRALAALAHRFNTETVNIDQSVFNAARISKLYGTMVGKGDPTPGRPHRLARILERPASLELVEPDLLTALASKAPPDKPARNQQCNATRGKSDFFGNVNAEAMANYSAWVPALFSDAREYQGGYRVSSRALSRGLEEDLSFHPSGIQDFGEERGMTPVDVVLQWGDVADAKEAGFWLCDRLGKAPADLGFRDKSTRQQSQRPTPPPAAEGQQFGDDAEKSPREWPTLDNVALGGLAGEVVRIATQDSEADPAAVLVTFLTWFGVAAGNSPRIMVGETPHCPRLFSAIVGASSRARKGTSKQPVKTIMKAAQGGYGGQDGAFTLLGPCPVTDGPFSSGEGLIYEVRDPLDGKDKDGNPTRLDDGAEDKRLLVTEGELGAALRVMQREGNTLSTTLRVMWDCGRPDDEIRPMTKKDKIKSTNPHVSTVGHITAAELRSLLSQVDLHNGVANRFLWVCARRTKLVPLPQQIPEEIIADLSRKVGEALNAAQRREVVSLTPAAARMWVDSYAGLSSDHPGAWGSTTSRAEAQVLRLALIYALIDNGSQIAPVHLTRALAFWRYCDASAGYLFGDADKDPQVNKVLKALESGPLTATDLNRALSGKIASDRITVILEHLQETGRVSGEKQQTKGRPRITWRLTDGFQLPASNHRADKAEKAE